jgi:hypothetical protein
MMSRNDSGLSHVPLAGHEALYWDLDNELLRAWIRSRSSLTRMPDQLCKGRFPLWSNP